MRYSARILFVVSLFLLTLFVLKPQAFAQVQQLSPEPAQQTTDNSSNNINNFLTPNADPDVPQNHHSYTQIVLIDLLSATMCQLTGIDPDDPSQPCLGVNPSTGKIAEPPKTSSAMIGQSQYEPQVGGALGLMANYISALYVPAVSSSQYVGYLADNFGIVQKADAATPATNCSPTVGYGFCGLAPIFTLWSGIRDFAYAMLTVLFIAIGIGVMLRFRVDPRTVMTLQNQIPRVIIAILLITFSYAIAGLMVDLMWTATYAGINYITSKNVSNIEICIPTAKPLSQALDQRLNDDPLSFTNTVFRRINPGNDCNNLGLDNGLLSLSSGVAAALGTLVTQTIKDLLGINSGCGLDLNPFHDIGCIAQDAIGTFLIWVSEQIVKLIVFIALLIALFRLWFKLIQAYVTFLIFVIMGPIWIVFGLIPGRPLGFEKWIRIVFANLAVFPLVAFLLTFARIIVSSIPQGTSPENVFIPPLVGNPNISTFTVFIGFGAIMLAPSVPDLIKERMKATGQGKYGQTLAAGLGYAAGAATSPARKAWEGLNRRNPTTGAPEGALAVRKNQLWMKTPMGRRGVARREAGQHAWSGAFGRGTSTKEINAGLKSATGCI